MTPAGITIQLVDGAQAAAHQDELEAAHAEVYAHPPYQRADDPAAFAGRFRVQRRQPGFVVAEARHGGYLVGLTIPPAASPAQAALRRWGWRRVARTRDPELGLQVADVLVTSLPV